MRDVSVHRLQVWRPNIRCGEERTDHFSLHPSNALYYVMTTRSVSGDTLRKWSPESHRCHRGAPEDFFELYDAAEVMVVSDGIFVKTMAPVGGRDAKIAQSSIPDESFEPRSALIPLNWENINREIPTIGPDSPVLSCLSPRTRRQPSAICHATKLSIIGVL